MGKPARRFHHPHLTKRQYLSKLGRFTVAQIHGEDFKETKDGSVATKPFLAVPDKLEAEVLKDCLAECKRQGLVANRNNVGNAPGANGVLYRFGIVDAGDIVGMLWDGVHFEVECKRGRGGRLSIGQQERCQKVRASKGKYWICHGVEELRYYLQEYKNGVKGLRET